MPQADTYKQPGLAVDLAILTVHEGALNVVLMPREDAVEVGGNWALPGGFVHYGTSLEQTVLRILTQKITFDHIRFEQLASYGDPMRDKRGHIVSIVYLALAPYALLAPKVTANSNLRLAPIQMDANTDINGAVTVGEGLDLAFDHAAIIADVVRRLRAKVDYTDVGFSLLPPRFTLREAQEVHEAIFGRTLTKPAFRRKLLDRHALRATGEFEPAAAFRPAELYELIQ